MFYAPEHSMSLDGTQAYKDEISLLKKQYQNEIDVFCGLEVDISLGLMKFQPLVLFRLWLQV